MSKIFYLLPAKVGDTEKPSLTALALLLRVATGCVKLSLKDSGAAVFSQNLVGLKAFAEIVT